MISDILIVMSWIFIIIGMAGLGRLKGVYSKLLSSSKIDSVATITLFIALMIRQGLSVVSLKLFVILVFYLITNPVTNQVIGISAYRNGVELKKEE